MRSTWAVPRRPRSDTRAEFDVARVPLASALFWLRTVPERLAQGGGAFERPNLRLCDIGRTGQGFMVLSESADRLAVGAIGRFWKPEIEFAPVPAAEFAAYEEPGWGKVAWELRCEPASTGARIVMELRVTATDEASWHKLRAYFALIGPFSHFFRRQALKMLAHDLGTPADFDAERPLAGDEFVPTAQAKVTQAITIDAAPSAVWPWLVQMGCGRAGWYSHDDLDNAGVLSETQIVPEFQHIAKGDVLAATPNGPDGFTVLAVDEPNALVLGALVDTERGQSVPIDAAKPAHYWHTTWAFVLEPTAHGQTHLLVRARAEFAPSTVRAVAATRLRALVHHFMETEQLANLKLRVEGEMPRVHNTWTDVGEGVLGAAGILGTLVTPFLEGMRAHHGLTRAEAERPYLGDEHVLEPRWQWTHAVDIDAPPEVVWRWLAQLGQDKAGFYSYQALENLIGSEIQNAARVHSEWQSVAVGDHLRLHHKSPPLEIVAVEPNRALIARAGEIPSAASAATKDAAAKHSYVTVSWALLLEPRPGDRTRLVSRFRSDCSSDLATRVLNGRYLTEAVGFVMDRRMLRGIKERAEREHTSSAR